APARADRRSGTDRDRAAVPHREPLSGAPDRPHRRSLRRFSRARPLPWAGGGHRRAQRPHGAAAGGGRASRLPSPLAPPPPPILGPPVHTAGADRRADRA